MKNFFIKKFQATLSLAIQLILRYPQISQKINQFFFCFSHRYIKKFSHLPSIVEFLRTIPLLRQRFF